MNRKDNRTIFDPLNNFARLNHNQGRIKKITSEIFSKYIISSKCYNCKLREEEIIPPCYLDGRCKFYIHYRPSPVVVTKNLKNSIYLTRGTLIINYYLQLPFILRATASTGLVIHHKDLNPFNDNFSNLAVITENGENGHASIHSHDYLSKLKRITIKYKTNI
jgi:hypothetical protein